MVGANLQQAGSKGPHELRPEPPECLVGVAGSPRYRRQVRVIQDPNLGGTTDIVRPKLLLGAILFCSHERSYFHEKY